MRQQIVSYTLSAALLVSFAAPVAAGPKPMAKPINVTGTWNTNMAGGKDLLLHQEGNLVWGKDHNGFLVRGSWSDGRLILFFREGFSGEPGSCSGAPWLLVMKSKGTATRLDGIEFVSSGETPEKVFQRASPSPGAEFAYPYGAELKECGSLPTQELAFDVNSDKLKGADWPLLKAVAATLKQDAALKIRILGHTDSTGDSARNKDLSQRRAESVKKVLVQKYGADEKRIGTKGWGDEQPLVSNDTDEGRAMNRRVEITVVK